MYFYVYKASSYSYTVKKFNTLEEVKTFLNIPKETDLTFKRRVEKFEEWHERLGIKCITVDFQKDLVATYYDKYDDEWEITLKQGDMEDSGEGFVDMLEESGALEYLQDCY